MCRISHYMNCQNKIAIVPLFKGSVRFNLDPFYQHSDSEIWAAVKNVHMAAHFRAMDKKLFNQINIISRRKRTVSLHCFMHGTTPAHNRILRFGDGDGQRCGPVHIEDSLFRELRKTSGHFDKLPRSEQSKTKK